MSNYIKRSDLLRIMKERKRPEKYSQRYLQWLADKHAILNAPSVECREVPGPIGSGVNEQELDKAIETLILNYQAATLNEHINNPLCYALYYTWLAYDTKRLKELNNSKGVSI